MPEINNFDKDGFNIDLDETTKLYFAKNKDYAPNTSRYTEIYGYPGESFSHDIQSCTTTNKYTRESGSNNYLLDTIEGGAFFNLLGLHSNTSTWGTSENTRYFLDYFKGSGIQAIRGLVPEKYGMLPVYPGHYSLPDTTQKVVSQFEFSKILSSFSGGGTFSTYSLYWENDACWVLSTKEGSSPEKLNDGPCIFIIMVGAGGGGQGGGPGYTDTTIQPNISYGGTGGQSGASITACIDLKYLTLKYQEYLVGLGKTEEEQLEAIHTSTILFKATWGGSGGMGGAGTQPSSVVGRSGGTNNNSTSLEINWIENPETKIYIQCKSGKGGTRGVDTTGNKPKLKDRTADELALVYPSVFINHQSSAGKRWDNLDSYYLTYTGTFEQYLAEKSTQKEKFKELNTALSDWGIFIYDAYPSENGLDCRYSYEDYPTGMIAFKDVPMIAGTPAKFYDAILNKAFIKAPEAGISWSYKQFNTPYFKEDIKINAEADLQEQNLCRFGWHAPYNCKLVYSKYHEAADHNYVNAYYWGGSGGASLLSFNTGIDNFSSGIYPDNIEAYCSDSLYSKGLGFGYGGAGAPSGSDQPTDELGLYSFAGEPGGNGALAILKIQ